MTNHLRRAREEIQRASERADGEVRENLLSLDEGLDELTEGGKTEGPDESKDRGERFEHVEEKLLGLMDETDAETETALRNARNELDAYRRDQDLA
ncbi:DUF7553 family protein [Halomicrococcus sp. NG-SE-24]|uniref:DUF7553 family protein n=1 Tax=Halomicrococcus sp. NG-SE-24 TaxID=3436928 RepID=UPI003D959B70